MSSPFQRLYPPQRIRVAGGQIIPTLTLLRVILALSVVIVVSLSSGSMAGEDPPTGAETTDNSAAIPADATPTPAVTPASEVPATAAPVVGAPVVNGTASPANSGSAPTAAPSETTASPAPTATSDSSSASTIASSSVADSSTPPKPTFSARLWDWFMQRDTSQTTASTQEKALAEMTASWEFQRAGDSNLDQWPDEWKRTVSREYPKYLPVEIVARNKALDEASIEAGKSLGKMFVGWKRGRLPSSIVLETLPKEVDHLFDKAIDRCLEMRLDGGSINLCSPIIPIEPRFYYNMQLEMSCQELSDHQVWAQLEILDEKENVLSVHPTRHLTGNQGWSSLEVNALQERPVANAHFGRVRILVEGPKSSSAAGVVQVDRIRIWKVPRIRMTLDRPANVFAEGEKVRVRVVATGLSEESRVVQFELLDRHGKRMENASIRFEKPKEKELLVNTELAGLEETGLNELEVDGEAIWNPQVSKPGFYTIRVELGRAANQTLYRVVSLAVINDDVSTGKGRFGWSLTADTMPADFHHLPTLAQQAALGWIKVPVWYDPHDLDKSDDYAWLIDRLQNLGLRCIGVFDLPPKHVRESFSTTGANNAAQLFQDPELWQPHLDPVLTRMSLSLVLFQLGADSDLSFQGYSNLASRLAEIRKHFQGFGQDIQVGLPWSWLDVGPTSVNTPSDFITLRTSPPLTSEELESYVKILGAEAHMRWISLEPLDARRYPAQHRIQNLAERMLVASKHRVEAAFAPNPIHENTGLMLADGSPTVLFLPWRTLAYHLTGTQYIGSFSLRGGTNNYVFERDGEAIMVAWNNKITKEQLYLGEKVQVCDLWGNRHEPETIVDGTFREQAIEFNSEPVVVTGLSLPVARWRISFKLSNYDNQVPGASRFKLKANFANGFEQSVVGSLELFAPELIHNSSVKKAFDLSTRQEFEMPIDLNLRPDASTGKQMVTAIFDIQAGTQYRFRVFHPLYIGAQDIEVELSYEVDPDGNLVIRQDLVNNTEKTLDFECTMFAPDRVHVRQQMLQIPPGRVTRYYRLPNAAELKGKTVWLRCEQLDTGRFLNYRTNIDW
jgi:hypothetical protein